MWPRGHSGAQALESLHTRGMKPTVGCANVYKLVKALYLSVSNGTLLNITTAQ